MTGFWLTALGLILLAYGLFWWCLRRPLKADRRDLLEANLNVHHSRRLELEQELQEGKISSAQFEALIAELDRELLDLSSLSTETGSTEDFKGLIAVTSVLALIPLIALALYFNLGRPDLIGASQSQNQALPAPLEAEAERLAARLQANPKDSEGWLLLGRTYQALGQIDKAKTVYEQALGFHPDDLNLKVRYAEVLAQLQEGDLRGKPSLLLQEVLKADPNHPYALWLAGLAALQEGDRELAHRHWQTLLDQMPPNSAAATQLREIMAKAGLSIDGQPPSAASVQVKVSVQLAPELTSRVHPDDPVYIFARAAQGPPMPLAIARKQVKDLPLTVTLDDTMAMMPQLKLSSFKRIVLGARVAKSGNAQGAPGDLEGWTGEVSIEDDNPHTIVIDRVRSS